MCQHRSIMELCDNSEKEWIICDNIEQEWNGAYVPTLINKWSIVTTSKKNGAYVLTSNKNGD